MQRIFSAAILTLMLQFAVSAEAASIVVDRVGTTNVYAVKGYDFDNVGGVEVEIQYDTATLANPKITQGPLLASTMFIPNTKFSASSVKIAAMSLSAIKGSDVLATITFDLKAQNPGPVSIGKIKFVGVTANKITPVDEESAAAIAKAKAEADARTAAEAKEKAEADARVAADAKAKADAAARVQAAITEKARADAAVIAAEERARAAEERARAYATISGSSSVGTITLPQDQIAAAEAGRKTDNQPLVTDLRKDMTLPLGDSASQQSSTGEKTAELAKELQKKSVTYKSALQLFKDFKGEKSAKSLIPLFAEISLPDFKQEPPIAFSDGKTPLKITLVMKRTGSESPKFLFQGANVKQLSGEGEEAITWTIDAVPKKDAVEATLTVIDGKTAMDFPLTIAPRIDPLLTKAKALSEADFAAYLAKPVKYDLNKDGELNAVDDFIYTANYIVAMKIKPEKVKTEEKADTPKQGAKDDPKLKEPLKTIEDKDKAKAVDKPPVKPTVKQ